MSTTTTTSWPGPHVVRPAIERPAAMRLADTEYVRVTHAVDALRPEDWTQPTDCTAWDVRQLVAHIAGMAKFISTPLEMAHQTRASRARQQHGQALVDAQTALQARPGVAAAFPASYVVGPCLSRKCSTVSRRHGASAT